MAPVRAVLLLVAALVASAVPAAAQGHRGSPPGLINKGGNTPSSPKGPASPDPGSDGGAPVSTPPAGITTADPRAFGEWLDDATLAAGGSVWLTAAVTRWTTPNAHGVDAPAIGIAAGLTPRTQLSVALPYSHYTVDGGRLPAGLGDTYAGVKILLVDRASSGVGISTSPTLEILNTPGSPRRAGFVLPVSLEGGRGPVRIYASAGFFTRGATFASAAAEYHASRQVSVTAAVLQSWSTSGDAATTALGLRRTRTDITGTVVSFVNASMGVYGSVGRTISPEEFDSTRFVISGGIALGLTPANQIPVRPPR